MTVGMLYIRIRTLELAQRAVAAEHLLFLDHTADQHNSIFARTHAKSLASTKSNARSLRKEMAGSQHYGCLKRHSSFYCP